MKTPNRPKRPDITVYEYLDYRLFLRGWIEKVADKQRGQLSRIAEAGRVHKTTLSQVFSGAKDLTPEQGCAIAKHLGLLLKQVLEGVGQLESVEDDKGLTLFGYGR